jgi:hypothetical protein
VGLPRRKRYSVDGGGCYCVAVTLGSRDCVHVKPMSTRTVWRSDIRNFGNASRRSIGIAGVVPLTAAADARARSGHAVTDVRLFGRAPRAGGDGALRAAPELVVLGPITLHIVSSGFPRWWRLGLAFTEVLLAAGLIVAAMTEGTWYWWAGAIAAATLALINLSLYLRTERVRRRPPHP